jgi:outer membrane protein assembly factor BamB
MIGRSALLLGLTASFCVAQSAPADENWPQWRGPNANGVAAGVNLPTSWSATENVVWKTELPAWSGGTPVIWGDRIFVTSPSKAAAAAEGAGQQTAAPNAAAAGQRTDALVQEPAARGQGQGRSRGQGGRRRGGFGGGGGRDPGGQALLLLCLSRQSGDVLWQRELDSGNRLNRKQNNTSPSPVTDGKHVWVVTGNGVVTALTLDGQPVWKRNLQADYGDFGLNWGYASSPLLDGSRLIIQVLHGMRTDDPSYVVALNSQTGEPLWRVERPTDAQSESPDAYTTPAVLTVDGRRQVVISGGDYVTGHDPVTGQEAWRVAGLNPRKNGNYRIVASPVVVGDMIIAPSRQRPMLALRAESPASVSEAWTWNTAGAPDVPTPVFDGKYVYMVDDGGAASCIDAASGERVWGPQRTVDGTVSASPILADGKLYIIDENAMTAVLAAGPEFQQIARNELDGSYTLSSPVAVGNQLFIRTGSHLYCISSTSAN